MGAIKRKMRTSIVVFMSLLVLYSLMSPVEGGATSIAACKDKQVGDSCLKACCITNLLASAAHVARLLLNVRWFLGRRCASSERIGLCIELENWFYIFNDW